MTNTKKIEVSTHGVEVGEPRIVRETRSTMGGLIEQVSIEYPPSPPREFGFWPVFVVDGEPEHPDNVLDAVLAGRATLITPFEEAHEAIHEFRERASVPAVEFVKMQRVLDASIYVTCREREARAWRLLGFGDGDGFVPPTGDRAFFSAAEVADLYGVNVATVEEWSGQRLPAGIRKGDALLFRAEAILSALRAAGPANPPARPPQDPKPANPKKNEKVTA